MAYAAGHRDQVRGRIVDCARRLFNRHGFDAVTVDQIMAGAGLTRGGFYSYFESKSDLYTEVLGCFFTDPEWKNRWEGVEVDRHAANPGPEVVRAYLSEQHFEDVENSCPIVALPSDVTRCGKEVKSAFETVFKAMVHLLESSVVEDVRNGTSQHVKAQAIAALCVGGMVVARAMEDRRSADELRNACMAVALELGGWPREETTANGNQEREAVTKG